MQETLTRRLAAAKKLGIAPELLESWARPAQQALAAHLATKSPATAGKWRNAIRQLDRKVADFRAASPKLAA